MQQVTSVSYPRSGHNLLINILFKYFSGDKNFWVKVDPKTGKAYERTIQAGQFKYCEYYKHCRTLGCTESGVNLQKSHDFKLDLIYNAEKKYIVQYRHPVPSIVSFFVNFARHKSYEDFISFSGEKLKYWNSFIQKWVIETSDNNIVYIEYDNLINDPYRYVTMVIKLIFPNHEINSAHLNDCLEAVNISDRKNINSFQYYDENFFYLLESLAMDKLLACGIEPIFNKGFNDKQHHSKEIELLKKMIRDIQNSWSWKITSPMRKLGRLGKK